MFSVGSFKTWQRKAWNSMWELQWRWLLGWIYEHWRRHFRMKCLCCYFLLMLYLSNFGRSVTFLLVSPPRNLSLRSGTFIAFNNCIIFLFVTKYVIKAPRRKYSYMASNPPWKPTICVVQTIFNGIKLGLQMLTCNGGARGWPGGSEPTLNWKLNK